jgi:hypothetical protein
MTYWNWATDRFFINTDWRRFFDIEVDSLDIPIVVPTKAWSKYMMRHKGKEQVEEGNSSTKVIWKWAFAEAKEIQKML